jgi:hypothetical protein
VGRSEEGGSRSRSAGRKTQKEEGRREARFKEGEKRDEGGGIQLVYHDEIWVHVTVNTNFMGGVLLIVSTSFV